jgi:glycosyltransferase involved in cell wall biosynthesis
MAHRASEAGFEMITWPFHCDYDPLTILAAYRYLRREAPDLIILVHGRDLRTVGVAARTLRIPLIWRVVAHPHPGWWDGVTSLPAVDRVLVPSESARQRLTAIPWMKGKIEVVPQGIDGVRPPSQEERDAARVELGWPSQAFVILFLGRLNDSKGLDVLLHSFAKLIPDHPEARLVLVGGGAEEEALRDLSNSLRVEPQVQFAGYVSEPARFLDACDLLVLPSRWETFGFVLLEAMARGKPIVASRIGGIPEVVGDEAGLLIPPDDGAALAKAIGTLAEDSDYRARLGEAGRMRAKSLFSLSVVHERIDRLFREVLARRRGFSESSHGRATFARSDNSFGEQSP